MDWVWPLYSEYVHKTLGGDDAPEDLQEQTFISLLSASTVTVLVQEPWRGSVRFKRLAVLGPDTMFDLLNDPEGWLAGRFGGGKFKLNFHHGMHFVATRNFKPSGPPRWTELPDIEPQYAQ
ncbi:MAG: hypothetical protein JJ896_00580 [Rhodothermales bacterium]|nr:hypothetical protein [Rhodothermales bacterium]MBO6778122.1 hypothetical protein [Rhodothermales bacterium]